jgi:D-alanyl-D-alanine dipeptidase
MNIDETLEAVISTSRLLVEPIWEVPIDEIEGPLYKAYIAAHPTYNALLVRASVKERLHKAAQALPEGLRLIVRAGHRPLSVQQQLLVMVKDHYIQDNPGASEHMALDFARTYVSDPAIKVPPHCSGSAIDVDVMDLRTGKLVDFGCPVNTDDEIAGLTTTRLSARQQKNREILQAAMLGAGFASFQSEWWHFSYGDKTWAQFYGLEVPTYGLIDG